MHGIESYRSKAVSNVGVELRYFWRAVPVHMACHPFRFIEDECCVIRTILGTSGVFAAPRRIVWRISPVECLLSHTG